jgi:type II secretory ATPase GspE/PulE/Tfp pilus assembly ATPase PilB-like protein
VSEDTLEGSAQVEAPARLRLGEALLAQGVLSERQLEMALAEQRQVRRPLGEILVALGFARRDVVARHLAAEMEIRLISARDVQPDPLIVSGVDPALIRENGAFPIRFEDGRLQVAMVDPSDPIKVANLRRHFISDLELMMILESDLQVLLRKFFPETKGNVAELLAPLRSQNGAIEEDISIERLTESIITDGIRRGATDIHLHPEELVTRIRFRLDGVLRQADILPKGLTAGVVSRIKILSQLDISERRRPQDGRMRVNLDGRKVDLRVSILPVSHGESVVLRVLDRATGSLSLSELGISSTQIGLLEHIAARPHGLFLVTGPTGSGKTTTLYSLLTRVDSLKRNVATIEDPVEYMLPFVRQSQVDHGIGFDFKTGLRSLMRQDPDVILVGEIRDEETAEMAVKASMTGHLVFSTLHTNNAIGSVPRLIDLGIASYLVEDSLVGALAQRLVRRNCSACLTEVEATPKELAWLGVERSFLLKGAGCRHCENSGYQGRTVIAELFLMDSEVAQLIRRGAPIPQMVEAGTRAGFVDMESDGRQKVLAGLTTVEEVLRVHRSTHLSSDERS